MEGCVAMGSNVCTFSLPALLLLRLGVTAGVEGISRLALSYVIGRINEENTQRRASLTKIRHKEERFRP